jgi:hypothetical protein
MKVVSPYRPFVPESGAHQALGPFDWVGALEMLRTSVRKACRCETYALTDVDTYLSGSVHSYATVERRLMLWLLEVTLCYLKSDDFDDDTILISPDALVLEDLSGWFRADLGLMVRTGTKYVDKPLLNGVQCWRLEAKDRLVAFYARVLQVARQSDPRLIRWGADTEPIVELLAPLLAGRFDRGDLSVFGFRAGDVFRSVPPTPPRHGQAVRTAPILDFKGLRKRFMADYFALARIA